MLPSSAGSKKTIGIQAFTARCRPDLSGRWMGSRQMHNTKAYKTCDGRLFDDEAEAACHEATIKIRDWAKRHNISSRDTITWNLVASAMLEDASELAYLFRNLARALPRKGGPADIGDEIVSIHNRLR